MFYFVSVTAISHVRSHFTHSRSVYRQFCKIITAQNQCGWGGSVVGVRGGDTDDTFHTNTFHTISQHPTEAVLHSFWWHSFIFKRWLSYMSWQSIYMTVKLCTCQIHSALQWCSKTRRFFNTLRPRKMTANFQTKVSNAFSSMKMYEFWLKFHWSLFLWVQLTVFHHWFR